MKPYPLHRNRFYKVRFLTARERVAAWDGTAFLYRNNTPIPNARVAAVQKARTRYPGVWHPFTVCYDAATSADGASAPVR